MPRIRKSAVMIAVLVGLAGAAVLVARGQSTVRPGEPTQSRVWIENRAPSDAVPVVVQSVATPVTVHLDSSSTVQTVTARQQWQYRTVLLQAAATGEALGPAGMDGWEAVGVLQSNPSGSTILFKRPR